MNRVAFVVRFALPAILFAAAASAQCAFSTVSTQSFGQGCNAAFASQQVTLGVELDAGACQLELEVSAFGGCCNTYQILRGVALGFTPVSVPLPQLGLPCPLLASPDLLLFQGYSATWSFDLPLPTVPLPPLTVYAQPAAVYWTSIGFTYDWALGAGTQIDLQ